MLHNALVFLVAAIISGILGFTALVGTPLGVAKVLCVVFAGLSLVSLYILRRDGA